MEELVIKLLELSRQLDEAQLGEFDFGRLQAALTEFERRAPELIQLEREHALLRDYLVLQVSGKARALQLGGVSLPEVSRLARVEAAATIPIRNLIEANGRLQKELNAVFATRPSFRRCAAAEGRQFKQTQFKIGG